MRTWQRERDQDGRAFHRDGLICSGQPPRHGDSCAGGLRSQVEWMPCNVL